MPDDPRDDAPRSEDPRTRDPLKAYLDGGVPADPSELEGLAPYGDDPAPGDQPPYGSLPPYGTGQPLDMSKDPDRYDPDRHDADRYDADRYDPDRYDPVPVTDTPLTGAPLDMSKDPDRYQPEDDDRPGEGQTLKDLLGEGAHEEDRPGAEWILGLIAVFAFLALISFVFARVLSP